MAAYFVFQQELPKGELKQFVFKLLDNQTIAQARAIIADGTMPANHVQGTIIPRTAPYNPDWSFHLDPTTIGFFAIQIEVCDANVTYVEEHLDEVGGSTLPNSFWCPWSSRLVAEITEDVDPLSERRLR